MGQKLWIGLPCLAVFGSLAVSAVGSPQAALGGGDEPSASQVTPGVAERASLPGAHDPGSAALALGFRYGALSQALAAQLGREPMEGVVVLSVEAGQELEGSGLLPHDVVIAIDGRPVREWLDDPEAEARANMEIRVVRGGVEETVLLGGEAQGGPRASAFLSVQDLAGDHPFRRAQTWKELGERYEEGADRFEELARSAKERRREAREEAKQASEALRELAAEQVRSSFDATQEKVLARVDATLDEALTEGLQTLEIALEELAPEERSQLMEEWFEGTRAGIAEFAEEWPRMEGGEEDEAERMRRVFEQIGTEAAQSFDERVGRVATDARRELEQHAQRLGGRASERAAWCIERVEGVRSNLHERITCAFDRAAVELDQALGRRLQSMDVPAAGELETAVREIERQVEVMADGFLDRTTAIVQRYEEDVRARNQVLRIAFAKRSGEALAAFEALTEEAERVLEETVGRGPLLLGDGWRTTTRRDELRGELRIGWRGFVTSARDAMRASLGELPRDLDEHEVACEDAWRDVQQMLGSEFSRSRDDCWKLDGPHLDGRFPRGRDLKREVARVSD